jgi:nicotinamidase/pyrazinamidase
VPIVNSLIEQFDHVVMTQDWHPAGHSSFASSHPGKQAFETVEMPYGTQTLWPDHCIQGTHGAMFHSGLRWDKGQIVIRKGFRAAIDSYSAFYENDHSTPTGLGGYLTERGIGKVTLCGLATDFCVAFSAIDARKHGLDVTVRLDACRGIDLGGSMDAMMGQMTAAGVKVT